MRPLLVRRTSGPAEPPHLLTALLAARLAWRQLRKGRAKLATAVAGVMFAAVLLFMQLGFRSALFDSATALPLVLQGDIFLLSPLTNALFKPEPFPRVRGYQTLADPDVASVVPIYLAFATWRNPDTGIRRALQLIGFDIESGAATFPGMTPQMIDDLQRPDTLAFDRKARPEFGDVAAMLARHGPFQAQVGDRRVEVVGLIAIGPSFAADGNAVMSELNLRRIVPGRLASDVDLVAVNLRKGANIPAVQARLRDLLLRDVVVLSKAELVAWEHHYWQNATPIGFIFGFGSLMGLVVGMVVVYQILFSDIASHIPEYATLKAMGYPQAYLRDAVMAAALLLALLGFIPSFLLCLGLYQVVADATLLPMEMTFDRALIVFLGIFGMCACAGLLAVRKLRDADPADMF